MSEHPSSLLRVMRQRCLTQADLAALAGLSPATISHAVNGRTIAQRSRRLIAEALAKAPTYPEDWLEAR
jgi:transcriptional regulator with XRE-family HTH domain